MRKTIVILMLVGCYNGEALNPGGEDGGADTGGATLPFPYTCGSISGKYVACCPPGEVCEAGACDCAQTPPDYARTLTVCRRAPDWYPVCIAPGTP